MAHNRHGECCARPRSASFGPNRTCIWFHLLFIALHTIVEKGVPMQSTSLFDRQALIEMLGTMNGAALASSRHKQRPAAAGRLPCAAPSVTNMAWPAQAHRLGLLLVHRAIGLPNVRRGAGAKKATGRNPGENVFLIIFRVRLTAVAASLGERPQGRWGKPVIYIRFGLGGHCPRR